VSEIAVAVLHGLQNKKSSLDKYYVLYEDAFEQKPELEKTFRLVLAEMAALTIAETGSRWRKKSDFYSLFLTLSKFVKDLAFSSNRRKTTKAALEKFGADVDKYLRGELPNARKGVVKYADAVERAATDLANRKARDEALTELIAPPNFSGRLL
jgi:hypothetical protein